MRGWASAAAWISLGAACIGPLCAVMVLLVYTQLETGEARILGLVYGLIVLGAFCAIGLVAAVVSIVRAGSSLPGVMGLLGNLAWALAFLVLWIMGR